MFNRPNLRSLSLASASDAQKIAIANYVNACLANNSINPNLNILALQQLANKNKVSGNQSTNNDI